MEPRGLKDVNVELHLSSMKNEYVGECLGLES